MFDVLQFTRRVVRLYWATLIKGTSICYSLVVHNIAYVTEFTLIRKVSFGLIRFVSDLSQRPNYNILETKCSDVKRVAYRSRIPVHSKTSAVMCIGSYYELDACVRSVKVNIFSVS